MEPSDGGDPRRELPLVDPAGTPESTKDAQQGLGRRLSAPLGQADRGLIGRHVWDLQGVPVALWRVPGGC